MKKIIYSLLTIAFVFSCSDTDNHGVDVNNFNGSDVTYFADGGAGTYFVSGASDNFKIRVVSTTTSNEDREYSILIDPTSTSLPNEYSLLSNSVTIPSGEYYGEFEVEGSVEGATEEGSNLILKLSGANAMVDTGFNLNIVKSCPLEADFTGDYLIEQITPYVDGPTLDDGAVVTLYTTDGSEFQRGFLTANFTNYCSTPNEFLFELSCGKVTLPIENNCNCSCASNYFFGAPVDASEYTSDDDTQFELTFTDDVYADCGSTTQTTYRFTKQ